MHIIVLVIGGIIGYVCEHYGWLKQPAWFYLLGLMVGIISEAREHYSMHYKTKKG